MEKKEKYGLFTSITMIIGTVIGSGIFFKADDVLTYTNGNILLGVLVFIIAAISIIFGCLTISQLATRTDKAGGIISYAEEFINKETASAFGYYQMFLYFGSSIAIVSWVAATYIFQLFGYESSLIQEIGLGVLIVIVIFILNTLSAKLGGYFQNLSMIIKLIPLIVIALFGFIKGNPTESLVNDVTMLKTFNIGVLSAFGPIAFSFDGWVVSTSVCNEIKNSKRNLPIALIVSPIIILICYICYFVGISVLIGADKVLALGNNSLILASNMILGEIGTKIILIFVIISVLGTCNGLALGFIRIPYSLAIRGMVPFSKNIAKENKALNSTPLNSALIAFIITIIWCIINYFYIKTELPGDVSEIYICLSYLCYAVLYIVVIRLTKKGKIKNKLMGYFVPIMALIGVLIILSAGINNSLFVLEFLISIIIIGIGYFYQKSKLKKINN